MQSLRPGFVTRLVSHVSPFMYSQSTVQFSAALACQPANYQLITPMLQEAHRLNEFLNVQNKVGQRGRVCSGMGLGCHCAAHRLCFWIHSPSILPCLRLRFAEATAAADSALDGASWPLPVHVPIGRSSNFLVNTP